METIGTIFLVTRKDVQTPCRVTSEANEHTFDGWRRVQREFNLAQVCGIEEKRRNYVDAVFKGGLKTRISNKEFRRYQETFGEYIESAAKASTETAGGEQWRSIMNKLQ